MSDRQTLYHVQVECEKKKICFVLGSGCYCGDCIRFEMESRNIDLYILATGPSTVTLLEELEWEGSAVVKFEASDNATSRHFLNIVKNAGYRAEKVSGLSSTVVIKRGDVPDGFRIRWRPCSRPYLEEEDEPEEKTEYQEEEKEEEEKEEEEDSRSSYSRSSRSTDSRSTSSGGISDIEDGSDRSYDSSYDEEEYEGYMLGDDVILTTTGEEVTIDGIYTDAPRPHCTVVTEQGYVKQVTACRLRPVPERTGKA